MGSLNQLIPNMSFKRALPFILLTACSAFGVTDSSDHHEVTVTGPLTLTVTDAPAQMGILFALPRVETASQSVVVSNTRYGSLCLFDVTGTAARTGSALTLDVTYSERLTSCVDQVRALTYNAQLTVPSGTYDLFVVHHQNNHADTLVHRLVSVP